MAVSLSTQFAEIYHQPCRLFRAPGRVNLIGEHTDYNAGFVMPVALQFATRVAAGPRTDDLLVLRSSTFPEEEICCPLSQLRPGSVAHHWSDYPQGVAWACREAGYALKGANLLIAGDVPMGAGLSSSASLEVSTALALLSIHGCQLPSRAELAQLCQRAENEYVGMRCGIMDQFISCCGAADHALMLDCRSLKYRLLPLSSSARVVICNSGVRHELAGGEYNLRRQACEEGAGRLGVATLRDASLAALDRLPPVLHQRCRHVVTENERVLAAAAALESGDLDSFGQHMFASHASLRDDYEVSCPELDGLVELARPLPGVLGARMTGGGFGGCTVNLVRSSAAEEFAQSIAEAYRRRTGRTPEVYIGCASQGAEEIMPDQAG